jgi:hypothetical protein
MESHLDLAGRYLGLVIRLLPEGRREWACAMAADLARVEGRAARLRFALGCTRVALLPSAGLRSAATAVAVASLVAVSVAVAPAAPTAGILLLLAWLGRRPGYLGPVRDDRPARGVRALGLAMAGSLALLLAVAGHPAGLVAPLLVTLLAASFLAATARGSRIGGSALGAGAGAGLAMGVAGFAVLPFERIGAPLADHLPAQGGWLMALVIAAPAAAALIAGHRTRRAEQAVMATVCAGAVAALTVALLGFAAIALFPGSVPAIVGPVMVPGATDAARQAENAIEASDPYWGFLVFGILLSAILWAVARPPTRAEAKLALLAVLALPPIALAIAGGAGTIALATGTVALAALVAARREGVAAA